MVERVAKAMYEKESRLKWEKCTAGGRLWWLKAARAAIEAMKEPTEKMVGIAFNDYMSWERQKSGIPWNAKRAYSLMIQAALDI